MRQAKRSSQQTTKSFFKLKILPGTTSKHSISPTFTWELSCSSTDCQMYTENGVDDRKEESKNLPPFGRKVPKQAGSVLFET